LLSGLSGLASTAVGSQFYVNVDYLFMKAPFAIEEAHIMFSITPRYEQHNDSKRYKKISALEINH